VLGLKFHQTAMATFTAVEVFGSEGTICDVMSLWLLETNDIQNV
jgi:hypothetical protein